jgi:anti-sigma regulatory factor (Ser/Thr protein kinase)
LRELSLHLLDLLDNSIRAGAGAVRIAIDEDPARNLMRLCVEDDGPGLSVPAEVALDPFYTTKGGKRTGLGLALLKAAAERAAGQLSLDRSALGGLRVAVVVQRDHVDRAPLGDLAATLESVVCTNPQLDVRCSYTVGQQRFTVASAEVAPALGIAEGNELAVAQAMRRQIRAGLQSIAAGCTNHRDERSRQSNG